MSPIVALIGTNTAVFAAWQASIYGHDWRLRKIMNDNFTLSNRGLSKYHRYHTIVTSFFSQAETTHFLFNMIALYTFGSNTLYVLGRSRFMALYFGGGLVSSACHLAWPYVIPRNWPAYYSTNTESAGLGASGAINSVIAWSILKFPRSMVYLYGVVPVPAALMGVGFVAMDGYALYNGGSNIGNAAHLGGAAFGLLFFGLTRRITPRAFM